MVEKPQVCSHGLVSIDYSIRLATVVMTTTLIYELCAGLSFVVGALQFFCFFGWLAQPWYESYLCQL